MAFECQETQVSLKNSLTNNPSDEQLVPDLRTSLVALTIATSNSEKDILKSVILEPISAIPPVNEILSSQSPNIFSADGYGCDTRRSITDLPSALVSDILHFLDARELAIVSCVSTFLHKLASDHHGWKDFYRERWGLPLDVMPLSSETSHGKSWKELFMERDFRSKVFMGRYSIDVLYGHTEAVRSVCILSSMHLIFTGGYDSVIRMWDVEQGLCIASSQPLGCTIRAVVADAKLLVVGGTDAFLQCWRAVDGFPHLFDISGSLNHGEQFKLWGHEGPISCLSLDSVRIYSGSWDMSVRVWDRAKLKCLSVMRHRDWVWSVAPRGQTVASTAGHDVYFWDIESGSQLEVIRNPHAGNVFSLNCSYTGDLLFTGGEDGAVHMFEVARQCNHFYTKLVARWIPHSGPVHSLAFEFPWLVSSSSDGRLSLIDVRKLLRSHQRSSSKHHAKANYSTSKNVEPPQRMLHGFGCNLFSVAIGADRIVCVGEEGVVRIWNFSQALEIEQRARVMKGLRLENRMRRRRIQLEMSSKNQRGEQCSVAAKKNQMHADRSAVWRGRRGINEKQKA